MTEERVVATDLGRDDGEVFVYGKLVGSISRTEIEGTWVEIGTATAGLNFVSEPDPEDDWTPESLAGKTISVVGGPRSRPCGERYLQILFGTRATIEQEVRRISRPTRQEAVMPTTSPSPSSPYYPPPLSGGYFAPPEERPADLDGSTWEQIRARLVLAASREPIPLREEPGGDSMKWKPTEDELSAEADDDVRPYTLGAPA